MVRIYNLSLAISILLIVGCAATPIVKKPGVNNIRSIAIISIYGNRTPSNIEGSGGMLTTLNSYSKSMNSISTSDDEGFGGTPLYQDRCPV